MTVPAWLWMAQQTPYPITNETLRQPARQPAVGTQVEKDFDPGQLRIQKGAGQRAAGNYGLGVETPQIVNQLAAEMADPKSPAQRYLDAKKTLGAAKDESTSATDKTLRTLQSSAATTTKAMQPVGQLMDQRNLVLGEVPAGRYEDFPDGLHDVALPGIKAERKRMNDLGGTLEALSKEAQALHGGTSLQPLLNWYQAEFGKDLGKGYKAPEDKALDLGKLAAQLEGYLTQGTAMLSDDELKYMQQMLTDKTVVTNGNKLVKDNETTVGEKDAALKLVTGAANSNATTKEEREAAREAARQEREDARLERERQHNEDKTSEASMRLPESRPGKALTAATELRNNLDSYTNALASVGDTPETFGAKAKELETAHGNLMTAVGQAAEFGVLQPSDISRLEKLVPSFSGFGGWKQWAMGGGKEGIAASVNEYKTKAKTKFDENYRVAKTAYGRAKPELFNDYYMNFYGTPEEGSSSSGISPEEAAAELARRKAAKGGK
jgi:hypothetical protein